MDDRALLIQQVARRLTDRDPGHPLRVGIDGVCGADKTTFAGELVDAITGSGRPVIRIDSDGFHHVRERRYRAGRESARGYYEDAFDFDTLADRVLRPLGPGGTRECALRVHDLESDSVITDAVITAPEDSIVIFDATFLQRDGLRRLWDEVVYLHVDESVAVARGIERDAARLGGRQEAARAYEARYMAACHIYLAEQDPRRLASIVVDNTDPAHPRLEWPART